MTTVIYTRKPGRGHVTRAASLARRLYDAIVLHEQDYDQPLEWAGIEHYKIKTTLSQTYTEVGGTSIMIDGMHYHRLGEPKRGLDMERFPLILPFRHEILSRESARLALGLNMDEKVLFSVQNLYGDSVSQFSAVFSGWTVISDFRDIYPLAIYLRAADAVIGNAGYNLYWETKLIGVPAFLVPQPQTSDQLLRATPKSLEDAKAFFHSLH